MKDLVKWMLIFKNIFKNYKDKMIIVVTHRKDNMDLFNKVWFLKDKRIKQISKSS